MKSSFSNKLDSDPVFTPEAMDAALDVFKKGDGAFHKQPVYCTEKQHEFALQNGLIDEKGVFTDKYYECMGEYLMTGKVTKK